MSSHRSFALLAVVIAALSFSQSPASAQVFVPGGLGASGLSGVRLAATTPDAAPRAEPSAAIATPTPGPERRVALVIGNSEYTSTPQLANPVGDARAVAQLLSQVGFEVVSAANLGREDMKQVISDFSTRVAAKGPNTVALVFYAGHGLQVDGENFLVPVDARLDKEADVPEQSVRLFDVMKALEAVPSRVRIVILDACRNNPFSSIGDAGGKGLAMVDAPAGSIVAYSTAPGTEALDGQGRHSPYAAAFMRSVKQPGLPIEQFFKKVRLLVHEQTDGKQTPWESSSLTSDFAFSNAVFNGPAPEQGAAPAQLVEAPKPIKKVQVAELRTQSPLQAYEIAVQEDQIEYYEEFVRLYPTDPLCDRIRPMLARRKQMVAWHDTVKANNRDAFRSFVERFPAIDLSAAARRLQERPRLISLPVFQPRPQVRPFPNGPFTGNNGPRPNGPFGGNGQNGPFGGNQNGPKPTGPIVNTPNGPRPGGPLAGNGQGAPRPGGPLAGNGQGPTGPLGGNVQGAPRPGGPLAGNGQGPTGPLGGNVQGAPRPGGPLAGNGQGPTGPLGGNVQGAPRPGGPLAGSGQGPTGPLGGNVPGAPRPGGPLAGNGQGPTGPLGGNVQGAPRPGGPLAGNGQGPTGPLGGNVQGAPRPGGPLAGSGQGPNGPLGGNVQGAPRPGGPLAGNAQTTGGPRAGGPQRPGPVVNANGQRPGNGQVAVLPPANQARPQPLGNPQLNRPQQLPNAVRPAPAPRPSFTAPAPRPSFQAPPRPSFQAAPRPSFQAAPRQSFAAPRASFSAPRASFGGGGGGGGFRRR